MTTINRREMLASGLAVAAGALVTTPVVYGVAAPTGNKQAVAPATGLFGIHVVDAQTGRGIPLVELRTVNQVRYVTDSAGYAAIADPGFMNRHVYFFVSSPGYTFPSDGFGYSGVGLDVKPDSIAHISMHRINVAQRIYRITGEGIYADSLRLGVHPPIDAPLLNGQVMGQDSCLATVYNGRIFWIWGDTARPGYPLGNFRTSGAVSDLPGHGGLNPAAGINLRYFTDSSGFCRAMCPLPDEPGGVVWLDGLTTVPDRNGTLRLVARYTRRKGMGKIYEQGLAVWNQKAGEFEKYHVYQPKEQWRFPIGHPAAYRENGREYRLFSPQFPTARAAAALHALADSGQYEAFTCLAPGTRYAGRKSMVERNSAGRVVWAWKLNTPPLSSNHERELISSGLLQPADAHFQLMDAQSHQPITIQNGSFFWNPFLKRWIMIAVQHGGASVLGEIWLAIAAQPTGPWRLAHKIATHPDYSFYNPTQNPFFDQENGRIIYFQGTCSASFSGNSHPIPRYDYNQLMYCLDLSDSRLRLE